MWGENKWLQLVKRKVQMKNFTGKGKYTVKVRNHPHTNMKANPATVRRVQMKEMELKRPAA